MGDLKDTHPHYVFASLDSELAAALPAEAETPTLPGRSSDSPKTTPVGTTLTETPRWLPKDSPTHTVSTAFPPDQDSPVDIVLISSDHVLFYTQTSQLIEVSDNALDGHLVGEATTSSSSPAVVSIPETSEVLNVVLHAIFSKSSNQYNPLLATLLSATFPWTRCALHSVVPRRNCAASCVKNLCSRG
ncbi:hypothetical protein BXZ70DRAFT_506367 [Cristinia sonorae]|uniref:Uncharacterized protein n=1 Tax=Cristinia sonorae TaxID=1940300 RepID=A0A8K0UWA6_9AGAR|nr:hypothetical protein BXZ70DRAFT_506367 [Cristinia sonorae]